MTTLASREFHLKNLNVPVTSPRAKVAGEIDRRMCL